MRATQRLIGWTEQGLVPDAVIRAGIRRLLRQRLDEIYAGGAEAMAPIALEAFVAAMARRRSRCCPHKANEQHYEVPAGVLCAGAGRAAQVQLLLWPEHVQHARRRRGRSRCAPPASAPACQRHGRSSSSAAAGARSRCGWRRTIRQPHHRGLQLRIAARAYPGRGRAPRACERHGHHRGHERLRHRASASTASCRSRCSSTCATGASCSVACTAGSGPAGSFFMHVFAHRAVPYAFEARDASDWMSRALLFRRHDAERRSAAALPGRPPAGATLALGRHALREDRERLAGQCGRAPRRGAARAGGHLRRATRRRSGCSAGASSSWPAPSSSATTAARHGG